MQDQAEMIKRLSLGVYGVPARSPSLLPSLHGWKKIHGSRWGMLGIVISQMKILSSAVRLLHILQGAAVLNDGLLVMFTSCSKQRLEMAPPISYLLE